MTPREYRVCWRRENDGKRRTRLYQTRQGAEDFARFLRLSHTDEIDDWESDVLTDNLLRVGNAVDVVVESRSVGEWEGGV